MKKISIINKKTVLALVLIVIVVAVAGRIISHRKVEVNNEVKNVKVYSPVRTTLETNVEYASQLKPNQEIDITPKSGGKVTSAKADIGAYVKAGQVLFTIDQTDASAQLKQSEASLASAQASYDKTAESVKGSDLTTAQQAVDKAKISYNDTKKDFDNTKALYESGAVSKDDYDNQKSRLDSAAIDYQSAVNAYNTLKDKSGPQALKIASASVQQAQSGIITSKNQIDSTIVKSPISGVVTSKNVEVGEMASSMSTAYTVMDTSSMLAQVYVPDTMLSKITQGQIIDLKITALGITVKGKVESISPSADSQSMAYAVKIRVDNKSGQLKPGMLARATLPSEKKNNVLTVPNEAIVADGGISYVYTVDNSKIKKVTVTTGLSNDKVTEIKSGIKDDDKIITEGQIFLNEGDTVKVIQ